MADFIYLMETRLSPDQQRAVALVTEAARNHQMNVYLTGGAVRDIISGFPIRDLDFSVQGNAPKLQKDCEKAGATVESVDDLTRTIMLLLPGNVRAEVTSTRSEVYEKPGKPPQITPGTIYDDMLRRDFTVNAMALSLNPGSRGLLKVLVPHLSLSKVDTAGLAQLFKTRQQMQDLGMNPDASPIIMHMLMRKLGDKEVTAIQKQIPNKGFVERWRSIEDDTKEFARHLMAKDLVA